MALIIEKLRGISVFLYTLIFLLAFNLYFNLNYSWSGVSLIVRAYIFILSFYMVFIFASVDTEELKSKYTDRFGRKGSLILFIEIRAIPFLLIYLFLILFTLIDYVRSPNWPWNSILSLINGRYSNTVIYPWLLLIILKLNKKPAITGLLFIALLSVYGVGDKVIGSVISSSMAFSSIKFLKIIIFLFFLFNEFFNKKKKCAVYSLILSMFFIFSIITSFSLIFKYSSINSFKSKESGLILIRMGFRYPLEPLKNKVIKFSDYTLLQDLLSLSNKYRFKIIYSRETWEHLLLNSSLEEADRISSYINNNDIRLSYGKVVHYAEQKSKDNSNKLQEAYNFIKISSKYYPGNEKDFLERLNKSNKKFKLWGIHVLAENKSIESIPLLINLSTDIDEDISAGAYNALKIITGMDPASTLDKEINDPDIIAIFRKYYLKHSHNHKAG